ncbi:tRNA (adenosine(37)-N6)-threonylcarbamoyltransferase complex dimerization subunit type 1 TsaB [Siccirubricoccus sp. G192]|uniref:tRNA (adenosine(37)-N6)-threonylcarbamoyltransferase complex dimerization subunit type 1 TsaB n=1 Tax=Siccirubricoccus sp. G192 TaxID=2849651 RepID=UPI001C2B89F1|nr:tRNA (adenosine(37)-N6)-threonylcarbamoyltransferase complex dimerization subunit type 1 TsaB [Siccirubricoccus sp. G192]MBV1800115.1 tRNA (adenosine(37)-N6)-threonylcarbamoyltransferase complex dimerization subunit type 1 TsaB [Siccirubricoccus sp. G192]
MWILALDASLARCSAAVLADGVVLAQQIQDVARGHAAALPPLAAAVLAEAGVPPANLDAVAAVVGPGGFTGLRAALALAEGIALGAGLPVIGVTTGEALAAALPEAIRARHTVWAVVDNRRGRVALERFAPGAAAAQGPPEILAEAELPQPAGKVAVVGDAAAAVAARLAARGVDVVLTGLHLPEAAAAARVAALRLAGRLPPLAARPLYVEPPAVRLPAATRT